MATAEKQQNPVKEEPQEDQKQDLRGPPQEEDSDDYYDDEYDDDYGYSDEGDDYYDDDEDDEQDTSGKSMQPYKGGQTISSRDQPPQNQNVQNGSVSRADEKKSVDDQDGLKLKLDVNLDIEVELKARIHGDLTLALL